MRYKISQRRESCPADADKNEMYLSPVCRNKMLRLIPNSVVNFHCEFDENSTTRNGQTKRLNSIYKTIFPISFYFLSIDDEKKSKMSRYKLNDRPNQLLIAIKRVKKWGNKFVSFKLKRKLREFQRKWSSQLVQIQQNFEKSLRRWKIFSNQI